MKHGITVSFEITGKDIQTAFDRLARVLKDTGGRRVIAVRYVNGYRGKADEGVRDDRRRGWGGGGVE